MGFLRFAQEPPGTYFILGHNDEELYVVAELLLNDAARNAVKELLDGFESHAASSGPFHFKTHPFELIDIKFYKKGESRAEDNPLEIDINSTMLDDLIDSWEFYMLSKPTELVLTRRHDTDTIKLSHEDFEE